MKKTIFITAGLAAVLGTAVMTVPGTAGAAVVNRASGDRMGCSYPHVCLYKKDIFAFGSPTGRFRDVTSGWQYLSRSRGATGFVNTRHDDVAYLLTTSGSVICVSGICQDR